MRPIEIPLRSWLLAVTTALAPCACEPTPPSASAPASTVGATAGTWSTVRLGNVPHVRQQPDFCGEACAAMAFARLGRPIDQRQVFAASGVDPALGRGVVTPELKVALERLGMHVGDVWYAADARRADRDLAAQFDALHADLVRGWPSIVCMHYDESPQTTEHFRLVVGYDAATDEVLYHEPAEDDGAYRRMSRARMFALWPLKYDADRWTVIRLRLEPAEAPAPAASAEPDAAPARRAVGGPSAAALSRHVEALKRRLGDGFTIVVEPPFVVVGDEAPDVVRRRSADTVRWAVDRLTQDFFDTMPSRILDVWLFRDAASYRANAKAFFGDDPSTPYGYYSSEHEALVMNIATGGGTLVHEIVHPFVQVDFDGAPAWLNEGLGSLFEQSGERDGHIVGFTNWRLPGLQRAIREHAVPSLRKLTGLDSGRFYDDDSGVHYAASRYLLYFLQERGLLVRFYREFRAAKASDPTGFATLQRTLGERDMDAFQARWERWVLTLRR